QAPARNRAGSICVVWLQPVLIRKNNVKLTPSFCICRIAFPLSCNQACDVARRINKGYCLPVCQAGSLNAVARPYCLAMEPSMHRPIQERVYKKTLIADAMWFAPLAPYLLSAHVI